VQKINPSDFLDRDSILRFLHEDIGTGDLTVKIVPEKKEAQANVITREKMVLCGREWFETVFHELNDEVIVGWLAEEGETVPAGTKICSLQGSARALLTGERTALNLLQTLSATATISRTYADAVEGTGARVLDTRKTVPGLRNAQKYAVRCGGCFNHRVGLYDGVLIKENHIVAAGSILAAVSKAKVLGAGVPVEVEVESLDEVKQALSAGADILLLDNFDNEMLREAVALNQGQAKLEASGNVRLTTIHAIAETGVDFISVGALTKNIDAVDLSMRIEFIDL
jgi:nicotinate-nucleotide pyrophosphorylase (carboxylating)